MNKKIAFISGKNNIDCFTVEKEKRIKVKAVATEPDTNETISILTGMETNKEEGTCLCRQSLQQKIAGYKYQDIRKNIHNPETLIHITDVIQKLLSCSLKCLYCKENVKIIYRRVRDPLQWTLDRIDNDLNHTVSNTVISCLSCNLKRRTTSKENFIFSQNLKIIKID